jgi:CYTH domain-containing protein
MIEIERKFLLKTLPEKEVDEKFFIKQYYIKNEEGVWERARQYHSFLDNKIKYVHTIKKNIGKGINEETEYEMTLDQFQSFLNNWELNKYSRKINKIRHVFNQGDLKWEVDEFLGGMKLIVAEIEIPTKKYKLNIPKFISDITIMEVTGIKSFSNKNLSKPKYEYKSRF